MRKVSPSATLAILSLAAVLVLLGVLSFVGSGKPRHSGLPGTDGPDVSTTIEQAAASPAESTAVGDPFAPASSGPASAASSLGTSAAQTSAAASSVGAAGGALDAGANAGTKVVNSTAGSRAPSGGAGTASGGAGSGAGTRTTATPTKPRDDEPDKIVIPKTFLTDFDWHDTGGAPSMQYPILHSKAGGTGTYADPISATIRRTSNGIARPAGTRFYVPFLRKYFIIEGACGGCKLDEPVVPAGAQEWFDLWYDGRNASDAEVESCAGRVQGNHTVIVNPSPKYVVNPGPVYGSSCATTYSESAIRS